MRFEPGAITALIGPSGCGKSTLLRCLNRMHEVIPNAYVEGEVLLDGHNLYEPGVDPTDTRRRIGMVFQRPNPFPTMTIKITCSPACDSRANRRRRRARGDRRAEPAARGAVGRSQRQAAQGRHVAVGRPAAAAVHRARARRGSRSAADGRAGVGARSDLDGEDRRADARAARRVHDRHRDPQHAAGGALLGLHRLHAGR